MLKRQADTPERGSAPKQPRITINWPVFFPTEASYPLALLAAGSTHNYDRLLCKVPKNQVKAIKEAFAHKLPNNIFTENIWLISIKDSDVRRELFNELKLLIAENPLLSKQVDIVHYAPLILMLGNVTALGASKVPFFKTDYLTDEYRIFEAILQESGTYQTVRAFTNPIVSLPEAPSPVVSNAPNTGNYVTANENPRPDSRPLDQIKASLQLLKEKINKSTTSVLFYTPPQLPTLRQTLIRELLGNMRGITVIGMPEGVAYAKCIFASDSKCIEMLNTLLQSLPGIKSSLVLSKKETVIKVNLKTLEKLAAEHDLLPEFNAKMHVFAQKTVTDNSALPSQERHSHTYTVPPVTPKLVIAVASLIHNIKGYFLNTDNRAQSYCKCSFDTHQLREELYRVFKDIQLPPHAYALTGEAGINVYMLALYALAKRCGLSSHFEAKRIQLNKVLEGTTGATYSGIMPMSTGISSLPMERISSLPQGFPSSIAATSQRSPEQEQILKQVTEALIAHICAITLQLQQPERSYTKCIFSSADIAEIVRNQLKTSAPDIEAHLFPSPDPRAINISSEQLGRLAERYNLIPSLKNNIFSKNPTKAEMGASTAISNGAFSTLAALIHNIKALCLDLKNSEKSYYQCTFETRELRDEIYESLKDIPLQYRREDDNSIHIVNKALNIFARACGLGSHIDPKVATFTKEFRKYSYTAEPANKGAIRQELVTNQNSRERSL